MCAFTAVVDASGCSRKGEKYDWSSVRENLARPGNQEALESLLGTLEREVIRRLGKPISRRQVGDVAYSYYDASTQGEGKMAIAFVVRYHRGRCDDVYFDD